MATFEKDPVIPIIDLGPFTQPSHTKLTKTDVAKQLAQVCETLGCFYVKNHGVDLELIKNTIQDHRLFFSQPQEYKIQYIDPQGNASRGYIPFEKQNVNLFMGRKGLPNDPIERYHFAPPGRDFTKVPQELWPDFPNTFKQNLCKYYDSMTQLAEVLMHALSLAINAPGYEQFIYEHCRNGEHRMKEHLYPPNAQKKPNQEARFPEHTDAVPFAILATSQCSGTLHALDERAGKWLAIDSSEDMLIVNLGDTMVRWTNGHWIAPIHKVAWPETKEDTGRVSLVFFTHANSDTILESIPPFMKDGEKPKFDPLPYHDLVEKRFKEQKKIEKDEVQKGIDTNYY